MLTTLHRLMSTSSALRNRVIGVYVFLALFNLVAWGLALGASAAYPILLPTAFLAYTFGLRHAVDADHIAAIDNSTRKLMQDGQRPVAVGTFFSLGHSTVVVALTVLVAVSAGVISDIPAAQQVGGLIGTAVSGTFLLVIGFINLVVLRDIWKMFRAVSAGGDYSEESLEDYLANRGLLARMLRPAMRLIRKSWHMYPLGFLFGLGFDTASEVALLGLAATSGAGHIPVALILILPALFAAGMCTIDSTDGILMLGAYGWAYVKPIRKLYYNLNITLVSVIIAFVIGGIEILSIVANRFGLTGGIWDVVTGLDFGLIGIAIIVVFLASWGVSTLVYRWKGYDDLLPIPAVRRGGLRSRRRMTAPHGDRDGAALPAAGAHHGGRAGQPGHIRPMIDSATRRRYRARRESGSPRWAVRTGSAPVVGERRRRLSSRSPAKVRPPAPLSGLAVLDVRREGTRARPPVDPE